MKNIIANVWHFNWDAPISPDEMFKIINSGDRDTVVNAFLAGYYDQVAVVAVPFNTRVVEVLEDIYRLTNSGLGWAGHTDHWIKNKEIVEHAEVDKCRSTSVGDLIDIGGQFNIVKDTGFTGIHMPVNS